jgi:hypothetical protein
MVSGGDCPPGGRAPIVDSQGPRTGYVAPGPRPRNREAGVRTPQIAVRRGL